MSKEVSIRIAGEAGQGMQTIGLVLAMIIKNCGLSLFANQDNMSRIRGGNNFFQLRISTEKVYALCHKVDILVALDKKSIALYNQDLNKKALIITDKLFINSMAKASGISYVPFLELGKNVGGSNLYANTVACGLLASILGLPLDRVLAVLTEQFKAKGSAIVNNNIAAAKAGYEYAGKNIQDNTFQAQLKAPKQEMILNGNQAIALGAVVSGCKFYSAYPMSPSTSIMEFIAEHAHQYNIIVEQAEDEIAALNMVIGASFAGARAMTSTSGGGFALMVEALSLAGMTETPAVIVNAQRPGPATGFPTRTEQADLNFLIHAGHGEFGRIIFSPGTVDECFYLTVRAFNLADKYQVPVLIMTDQHLAESYVNIPPFEKNKYEVKSYLLTKKESAELKNYQRYAFTASGVSPRAVPSWVKEPFYVDSDEHNEAGHITEDAELRNKMVEKRFYKRMKLLQKELIKPVAYNLLKAKTVLIGFGSTHNVLLEASRRLKNEKIGFIHLPQVWPFPAEALSKLLPKVKKIFTVENNAGAQLAGLIKRETALKLAGSILKYDGRPFSIDELCLLIKERVNAK